MENLDNYDVEFEEIQKKRIEYLKKCEENEKIFDFHLEGFFFVEDVKDEIIPEEFEQCLCVFKKDNKYDFMIGIWDKSSLGCLTDSRGSFFDGIGGHFNLDEIFAWCPINSLHTTYTFKKIMVKLKNK